MTQDGRIRVLMIISGLSLGGAEGNLLKLVERIDPERFLPIVVSLSGAGLLAHEIRNTGVLLHELRMERRFLASMRKLLQISRQVRPDVIHGWMYHGNAAASLAAMFLRPTPAVVHGIRASPLAVDQIPVEVWGAALSSRLSCLIQRPQRSERSRSAVPVLQDPAAGDQQRLRY